MNEEIQKLNEYVKMGSSLPKQEFATSFKNVVRMGNNEEVLKAYAIISSLIANPDLELFARQGLDTYKQIQKSHIGIDMLYSKLQSNQIDISLISNAYSKITDAYFLREANRLLSKYPSVLEYIEIRKTKKEIEEEKESLKEEFYTYEKNYSNTFERLNKYLMSSSYSSEYSKRFTEELDYLEVFSKKYKDILGEEKYKEVIKQISEAKNKMQVIISDIEEEQKMWTM